ncbi:MAG: hypothetical protein HY825_09785 [Acidobacteria bacterium]|nr:hypothetical protein [Acidobacteriota bacterium]
MIVILLPVKAASSRARVDRVDSTATEGASMGRIDLVLVILGVILLVIPARRG